MKDFCPEGAVRLFRDVRLKGKATSDAWAYRCDVCGKAYALLQTSNEVLTLLPIALADDQKNPGPGAWRWGPKGRWHIPVLGP